MALYFKQATVVDVFSAFEGQKGLLLIEEKGAEMLQIHPANAGYGLVIKVFDDAIRSKD